MVDLGRHAGPVLAQPLGDLAGGGGGGAVALDDRDDLVVVGHQHVEQAAAAPAAEPATALMPSRAMPR